MSSLYSVSSSTGSSISSVTDSLSAFSLSSSSSSSLSSASSSGSLSASTARSQTSSLRTIGEHLRQYVPALASSIIIGYAVCDQHGANSLWERVTKVMAAHLTEQCVIEKIVGDILNKRHTDQHYNITALHYLDEADACAHFFGDRLQDLTLTRIPEPNSYDTILACSLHPRTIRVISAPVAGHLPQFLEQMLPNMQFSPRGLQRPSTFECRNMQFNQENFQVLARAARQGQGFLSIDLSQCWSEQYNNNTDRSYEYFMEFLRAGQHCSHWNHIRIERQDTPNVLLSQAFERAVCQNTIREDLGALGYSYEIDGTYTRHSITIRKIFPPINTEQKGSDSQGNTNESTAIQKRSLCSKLEGICRIS